MIYTLQNDCLSVSISDHGAELKSVMARDGCEYLWQADAAYWGKTAPWLFPICGGLFEGKYTYRGKTYCMGKHGFVREERFAVTAQDKTSITFSLAANERTRACYPFEFVFSVTYELTGDTLDCRIKVENKGAELMYASVGGHPGFRVPFDGAERFDHYYLEFSRAAEPRAVVYTENFYDSGSRTPYTLKNGTCLPLSHDLFKVDGIFLANVAESVTLRSDRGTHRVTLTYGNAPYVGIWSSQNDGPFVCIEPWWGITSREGSLPIEEKGDMFRIPGGEGVCVSMAIRFW